MNKMTHGPRVWLISTVLLLCACLIAFAWGISDSSAPADSAYRPAVTERTSDGLNAYRSLQQLVQDLAHASERDAALKSATRHSPPTDAAAIVRVVSLDFVRQLPLRIAPILEVRALVAPDGSALGSEASLGPQTIQLLRLEALAATNLLRTGDINSAWGAARSGLLLANLLQNSAVTLSDLAAAQTAQTIAASAIARGIRMVGWSSPQLHELLALPQLGTGSKPLISALRNEYQSLFSTAARLNAERGFPLDRFAYHPNDTRRAWIAAIQPTFAALQADDVAKAHRQFERTKELLDPPLSGRNELGFRLVRAALASYGAPIENAVTSALKLPLLQTAAALELYRRDHERLPNDARELAPNYIPALPVDAWSPARGTLRYDANRGAFYTVGPNAKDDGGLYEQSLVRSERTDDFGVRLTD